MSKRSSQQSSFIIICSFINFHAFAYIYIIIFTSLWALLIVAISTLTNIVSKSWCHFVIQVSFRQNSKLLHLKIMIYLTINNTTHLICSLLSFNFHSAWHLLDRFRFRVQIFRENNIFAFKIMRSSRTSKSAMTSTFSTLQIKRILKLWIWHLNQSNVVDEFLTSSNSSTARLSSLFVLENLISFQCLFEFNSTKQKWQQKSSFKMKNTKKCSLDCDRDLYLLYHLYW